MNPALHNWVGVDIGRKGGVNLIVLGTNHKYSPIDLRERLSFSKKRLKEALTFLKEHSGLEGMVILSTCNRVEIYASCNDPEYGLVCLKRFLSVYQEIDRERLAPYLYKYVNKEALKHLFCVACGLDSQVLGETEILGQVRFFYDEARRFGFTDRLIDTVFNKAIRIARIARIKTRISSGNISIASTAINLIKQNLGDISGKKILLIGVGEISELVLKYLQKENTQERIFISNRTYEKAVKLAKSLGVKVVRFDKLKEKLKEADIIITATSSPHLILKKDDISRALNHQPSTINHQLLIIDLALPRDVEPEVKFIKGVNLFCLDDLDFILGKNLEARRQQIPKVLEIIDEGIKTLWSEVIESEPAEARLP